jgi:peptide/nickel transport system permease protein
LVKLILSRIAQGVVVLLIVSVITFSLLAAAGGDALAPLAADPLVSPATIEQLRHTYGLDQPLYVRYARWLGATLRGEMGESFTFKVPVLTIIKSRFFRTLELSAVALVIAVTSSFALGVLAAREHGNRLKKLSSLLVLLASSTPRIVLALVLLALIVQTSIIDISDSAASSGGHAGRLFAAAFVLSVPLMALLLSQIREGLSATLREDFIKVARAKGLGESSVLLKHALRVSLNPVITILGYSIGGLISGSVIVETVLGWPGLGQLSVLAVRGRDVPLLMGVVLITAIAVLVGNLIADILLVMNDPRLRSADVTAAPSQAARGSQITV